MNHTQELPLALPLDDCWNRIGVQGDHTCPKLQVEVHCRNCQVFSTAGRVLFEREPPQGWDLELTKSLAEAVSTSLEDSIAILIFRIGNEYLGMEAMHLVEVAPTRKVHRIPNRMGGLLEGIVNIRGELQLCVSLATFLGIFSTHNADALGKEKMLVLEYQNNRWVTRVDEVFSVFRIEKDTISTTPATVRNSSSKFTKGVFPWNGHKVGYLGENHVFQILEKSIS